MHCLIAQHGFAGARIPLAVGITLKVSLTNQGLLDLFDALRLQVNARQALLASQRARLRTSRMPCAAGTLVLGGVSCRMIRRPFHGRGRGHMRSGFSRGRMHRARVMSYPSWWRNVTQSWGFLPSSPPMGGARRGSISPTGCEAGLCALFRSRAFCSI